LTRLLHEFFTDDGTRIGKGANRAVGKYMETFVRETIAKAAFEKQGEDAGVGAGFMEVRVNV
jgi:centromere protein X